MHSIAYLVHHVQQGFQTVYMRLVHVWYSIENIIALTTYSKAFKLRT